MMNPQGMMYLIYPIAIIFNGFLVEPYAQEKLNGKVKSIIETRIPGNKDEQLEQTVYQYNQEGYLINRLDSSSPGLPIRENYEYSDGLLTKCRRIIDYKEHTDEIQYVEYRYDNDKRLIFQHYYGDPSSEGLGFEGKATTIYDDVLHFAKTTNMFNNAIDSNELYTPAIASFTNKQITEEWMVRSGGEDTVHRYYTYNKRGSILKSRTKTKYYDVYTCFDENGRKLYSGRTNDSTKKHDYIYSDFDSKGNYRRMLRTEDSAVIIRQIEYY